jgi:hypothetical protein
VTALRTWLARRSERERRLLGFAGAAALVALGGAAVAGMHRDLATLRARVAARTVELAQVRRLAATAGAPGATDGGALLTRVQAATDAAGVGERVAAMTPAEAAGDADARLAVRVGGASLAETVHLLHALDAAPDVGVPRLSLRRHADDPRRFDVTLEVAGTRR